MHSDTARAVAASRRWCVAVALATVVAFAAVLAITVTPARAYAAAPHDRPAMFAGEAVTLTGGHSVQATSTQILRFWTKERLAKARPFPLPRGASSTQLGSPGGRVATGPSVRIPGSLPSFRTPATTRFPSVAAAGNPSPWWNSAWVQWSAVGRLYSYDARTGWFGWYTGTVVHSQNQSSIWTAGHCLASGGYWHKYLLFTAGQNGGNAPYGNWPIRYIDTSATWLANNDCEVRKVACPFGADYGVAVADRLNGNTLSSRVGSHGIWFGKAVNGLGIRALGYPSSKPYFDQYGGNLFYCDSSPSNYFLDGFGNYMAKKPCGMNGGASGGPWLYAYGSSWYLVSNNSSADTSDAYGNPQIPTFMTGPFLDGTTAKGFYDLVQTR